MPLGRLQVLPHSRWAGTCHLSLPLQVLPHGRHLSLPLDLWLRRCRVRCRVRCRLRGAESTFAASAIFAASSVKNDRGGEGGLGTEAAAAGHPIPGSGDNVPPSFVSPCLRRSRAGMAGGGSPGEGRGLRLKGCRLRLRLRRRHRLPPTAGRCRCWGRRGRRLRRFRRLRRLRRLRRVRPRRRHLDLDIGDGGGDVDGNAAREVDTRKEHRAVETAHLPRVGSGLRFKASGFRIGVGLGVK